MLRHNLWRHNLLRHNLLQHNFLAEFLNGEHRRSRLAALALAAALTLAACSGDSDQQAAPQQAQQQQVEQPAPQPQPQAQPEPQAQPAAQQQAEPQPEPAQPPEQQETEQQDAGPDDGIVYDPDRDTLNEGELFGSSVTAADEVKQFRFAAEEGEWLRITVDGRGGMDPILTVLQPDRTDIARNDDRSATNRDSLLVVRIPTSGDQVLRVGAFDAASLGDFVIQVERLTVGADADSGIIAVGSTTNARLDFPSDVDAFEFSGRAGQTVTISISGDTGVDVYTQLLDPDNTLIASDDDSGHGLDAEMSLTLEQDGTHRIEVWAALNLEGQRQLIGAYTVIVREDAATGPLDERTAGDTTGVAITFLDALRQGDSATILALAGPEALTTWGWQDTTDVDRDLIKMQSIGLGGAVLQTAARSDTLNEDRARVYLQLAENDWLRFELISVGGLWTVDFWSHQSAAPLGVAAPADAEEPQSEPQAEPETESETESADEEEPAE